MKRPVLFLAAALIAAAVPALSQEDPTRPSSSPDPLVTVKDDTLTYIGGTNDKGLQALRDAVRAVPRGRIRKMVVNSGGGDTAAGLSIGAVVADLAPDLTIEVGCFSSCANYIAPAAKSITIRENAFLGWHGNDRQYEVIAKQTSVPVRDQLRAIFRKQAPNGKAPSGKPVDIEALVEEAAAMLQNRSADESAFYSRLGVADTFAVCGVGSRFDARVTGEQRGWGFSITDMARLGLPPVTYQGQGAYEENPTFRRYLILLTRKDC